MRFIDFVYELPNGMQDRYRRQPTGRFASRKEEEIARWQRIKEVGHAYFEGERLSTKAQAFAAMANIHNEAVVRPVITLAEFRRQTYVPGFMASMTPASQQSLERWWTIHLDPMFGHISLADVGEDVSRVREFGSSFRVRGTNPRNPINHLLSMLNAAVQTGALLDDPAPRVLRTKKSWYREVVPKQRKLDQAEIWDEAAIATARKAAITPALHYAFAALSLAYYGCMRMGEVRGLEAQDIDFERGLIYVRRQRWEDTDVVPKSKKSRVTLLPPPLEKICRELVKGKLPKAKLMVNSQGIIPTRQNLLTEIYRLCDAAGLPRRSLHAGRHGGISFVAEHAGASSAMQIAGHSSLAVTDRYTHQTSAQLERTRKRLPW